MRQWLFGSLLALLAVTQAVAGSVTITGGYIQVGPAQLGLAIGGSAVLLTVPAGAEIAEICVETASVRYRDDGTAPTTSSGVPVFPVSSSQPFCFAYGGPLQRLQFIAVSGSPTLDVVYYKTSE